MAPLPVLVWEDGDNQEGRSDTLVYGLPWSGNMSENEARSYHGSNRGTLIRQILFFLNDNNMAVAMIIAIRAVAHETVCCHETSQTEH